MFKKLAVPFVIAVVALVLALSVLPQADVAQAQFEVASPTITGTTTMLPGQNYVLTATGFAANEEVDFFVGNIRLYRGTADGSGELTGTIKAPLLSIQGTKVVKAQNVDGNKSDTYNATLNPVLLPEFASGAAGAVLDVNGYALAATEAYTIYFTDAVDTGQANCIGVGATVSETVATGTTSKFGSLKAEVTVPSVPDGTYYFVGIGEDSAVCAED